MTSTPRPANTYAVVTWVPNSRNPWRIRLFKIDNGDPVFVTAQLCRERSGKRYLIGPDNAAVIWDAGSRIDCLRKAAKHLGTVVTEV